MPLKNTTSHYGWISVLLHWTMALLIVTMFVLGLWMDQLSYYDPWYRQAPFIHKSLGMILLALLAIRVAWKMTNLRPGHDPALKNWQRTGSRAAHTLLYLLMLALMLAGYLISTADGRSISVFNWFEVPATLHGLPQQEDVAGEIHEWLAWTLIALAGLHAAAALKHHFIDRDSTLIKMLGRSQRR